MEEKERFDCDSKSVEENKAPHRVANLHQCRTICSRNCAYKLEQSTNSIPENQLSFTNPECRRTLNEVKQPSSQNHPRRKEQKKKTSSNRLLTEVNGGGAGSHERATIRSHIGVEISLEELQRVEALEGLHLHVHSPPGARLCRIPCYCHSSTTKSSILHKRFLQSLPIAATL